MTTEEKFLKDMTFKSGVIDRGSDYMVRAKVVTVMRWYAQNEVNQEDRRKVNRMRLTKWRKELILQVRWCISIRWVGDL